MVQFFVVAVSQLKRPEIQEYLKWAESDWSGNGSRESEYRQSSTEKNQPKEKKSEELSEKKFSYQVFVSEIIHQVFR